MSRETTVGDDGIVRSATLSKDGVYRYVLHRDKLLYDKLDVPPPKEGRVVWIMLNPSTADATNDDPTIRRCIGFTREWGYNNLTVVNLFALRATDPRELQKHVEKIEDLRINMDYITAEAVFNDPDLVVCAWGTHGGLRRRNKLVIDTLNEAGARLNVLRLSEDRHPAHPLYLPKTLKPIPWNGK